MRITLFDRNGDLCEAWRKAFDGCADVRVTCCDLASLPFHDAIVSPGNSFGVMVGGLDRAIRDMLGYGVQDAIQDVILRQAEALQPGQAVLVGIDDGPHGAVMYAPTMYAPRTACILDVCYAMTASLFMAAQHGKETVAIPGLGTGVGGAPLADAARAMRAGYDAARTLLAGPAPGSEMSVR